LLLGYNRNKTAQIKENTTLLNHTNKILQKRDQRADFSLMTNIFLV
jgi:hypothetical protein